jgi:putative FmdB family regulatory protein
MPLFEYLCKACGKGFERIVPRHDTAVDCPHCASAQIEKQLSVFAVSTSQNSDGFESAPGCGRCGASEPGMCQM